MRLIERVQGFAARSGLWTPETSVLAAVSGGSDSVALLLVLHELASQGHLRLAGVSHLNHGVRGGDAGADAAFVGALARRLGLRCGMGAADVPAEAREAGTSLELAGRLARLRFFDEELARTGADVVALAHTQGDQAETVLLRLARGAGSRGLAGMAPRAGRRIRPLLEVARDDLRAFLASRGQPWREDATNEDRAHARNRVRHAVMPELAAINPRAEEAIVRAARILAADAAVLDDLARAESARLLEPGPGRIAFDPARLAALPEALARRVVLAAFETLDPGRAYGWEETAAVLAAGPGSRDLGRIRMERIGGLVVLIIRSPQPPDRPAPAAGAVTVALEIPGTARHPAGAWVVEADGPMAPGSAALPAADRAVLDAEALGRHLTVRGWRAGDRVQPLGLRGRKKLQDVFVDRKVPRDERGFVPVVVDGRNRIAWVAGHVVGEPFRVTPHSAAVVVLTLRR